MYVKGRQSGSKAQLVEWSHGKREALGSSPSRATIVSSPVTFVRITSIEKHVSLVPPLFRAASWMNLISRGDMSKVDQVAR